MAKGGIDHHAQAAHQLNAALDLRRIRPDAFGNALGSSIADLSNSAPATQGFGPNSGVDYVNGMDLQSDDVWHQQYIARVNAMPGRGFSVDTPRSIGNDYDDTYGQGMLDTSDSVTLSNVRATGAPGSNVFNTSTAQRTNELQRNLAELKALGSSLSLDRGLRSMQDLADAYGASGMNGATGDVEAFDNMESPSSAGSGLRPSPELVARFGQGLVGAVRSVTAEPLLQIRDLGFAGASVVYNELLRSEGDVAWLPGLKSGLAAASAGGISPSRLVLQSNPITGPGFMSYDLTTAVMNDDWGSVAELGGGLAGGLAIGKGLSKYGAYGFSATDIAGAGMGRLGQAGAIGVKFGRLPVSAGEWTGVPGDSGWMSTKPSVVAITNGSPVPFVKGYPEFSKWSQGTFTFENLTGTKADFRLVYREVASEFNLANPTQPKRRIFFGNWT